LEADGFDAEPIYSTIVERMSEAGSLRELVEEGTDTPDDHQAFADNGAGLYDELRPMLRTMRGLDPSGGVSFANDLGDQATDATDAVPDIDYQTISDDTGVLTLNAPTEWAETDTEPLTLDKATDAGYAFVLGDRTEAPWIEASPSIADLDSGYETPGLIFTVLPPQASLDETLGVFAPPAGACTAGSIDDYSDGVYTGRFQTFTDCGGTSSMVVTVAAVPADNSFTAVMAMQIVSDADLAVLDQVIESFSVTS
jgi:serine protease Do